MKYLYLDFDGVLADFDGFILQHTGRHWNDKEAKKKETWEFIKTVPNFFNALKLTPYAYEIYDLAKATGYKVEGLTAIPWPSAGFLEEGDLPTSGDDKKAWALRYFGEEFKVNLGPYAIDKQKWCRPGDVLVDDSVRNIDQWNAAGGVGILHKYDDPMPTLERLYQIIMTK